MEKELLDYFKGDDLAASAWKAKYAVEGEKTPDDMHRRLAREFYKANKKHHYQGKLDNLKWNSLSHYGRHRDDLEEEDIYNLFKNFGKVVPQGSVMSQLGANSIGSLSNCFVIGQPYDSYGGIMQKDQEQVQLMKRRGGVGQDLSTLRPATTPTSNAAKTSTGAVSFMPRFSHTTREVAQDGRRGALMLSLDVRHPDALDFVKSKSDLTQITGANISIRLTDKFMEAVENDDDFYQTFPIDLEPDIAYPDPKKLPYNELLKINSDDPEKEGYMKKIRAKELWDEIIKAAHGVAEPGIFFVDNHWNYSPDGLYNAYRGVTTNPCGEIFMQPYDACRLIALNLFGFVKNAFTKDAYFDTIEFYKAAYEAMVLSDDLVDLELKHIRRILNKIKSDPEPDEVKKAEYDLWKKIYKTAQSSRRTGLGYTALGDVFAALGLKYDSNEAKEVLEEEIEKVMFEASNDASVDMAITRNGTFKGWNPDTEFGYDEEGELFGKNDYFQMIASTFPELAERMYKFGRRNVSLSTLAPTGTVSLMTQTTSGLEPVFSWGYMRRKKINPSDTDSRVDFTDANGDKWQEYPVIHPKFKEWLILQDPQNGDVESPNYGKVDEKNYATEWSKEALQEAFEESPWYGSTANEIDWIERVEIQGIIQRYTSHSISSTINLPKDVSVDEVSRIYMEGWKRGLKGVTVYRDGSRDGVLVSTDDTKEDEITKFNDNHAPTRPKYLDAKVIRFNNNKEKWVAFVGLMDDKPYEIFTGKLEDIDIPYNVEDGRIMKEKSDGIKTYSFLYEGGVVEDIGKVFEEDFWNYGKLISATLRHGMPVPHTVNMIKSMTFKEDHINTWKNGVARALKRFIPDGEVKGVKCQEPDCGSTNIRYEEGCLKCLDCGSSKCG